MMSVSLYNQADPQWDDVVMSPSDLIMRKYGCLVSSLSMALRNYAIDINPGDLCRKIVSVGGFDAQGYFNNDITRMFPNVLTYERGNTTNLPNGKIEPSAALEKIKSLISAGQPVLVWVDNVKPVDDPDHWVVVKDFRNSDLLINNPDGGVEQWFFSKYGDPLKKIFGYLALIGPPVEFPDGSSASDKKRGQAMFKAAQVYQGKNVKTYAKEILQDLI